MRRLSISVLARHERRGFKVESAASLFKGPCPGIVGQDTGFPGYLTPFFPILNNLIVRLREVLSAPVGGWSKYLDINVTYCGRWR